MMLTFLERETCCPTVTAPVWWLHSAPHCFPRSSASTASCTLRGSDLIDLVSCAVGDSDAIERVEAGDAVPFVNDSELGKLTRFEQQLVHSGV